MKKTIYSKQHELFIQELRSLRIERGVSQVELAKKLKTSQSIVSKCERGERRIDVIELRDWLKALGGSLPEFAKHLETKLGHKGRR